MTDNAYKPAGYCPHCGYAIDPGVCPECGKNVAADELDSVPYWVRRRRKTRRTVLALVILSLAIGGWYVYSRCNWWILWVPTRVLLAFQGDVVSRSAIELDRRFMAGELSRSQLVSYITNAVVPDSQVTLTDDCPCDVGVAVKPQVRSMRLPASIYVKPVDWKAAVDGKPVELSRRAVRRRGPYHDFVLPAMSPGTHQVDLQVTLQVVRYTTVLAEGIPVTLRGQVTVSPSRLADRLKLLWTPELVDEISNSSPLRSRLMAGNSGIESVILIDPPVRSVPIVATIEVRPTGQERYVPYMSQGGLTIAVADPNKNYESSWIHVRALNADAMDIRLVPDPEEAYRQGFTECLDAVVEWRDIPISPPPGSAAERFRSAFMPQGTMRPTLDYQPTVSRPSR